MGTELFDEVLLLCCTEHNGDISWRIPSSGYSIPKPRKRP